MSFLKLFSAEPRILFDSARFGIIKNLKSVPSPVGLSSKIARTPGILSRHLTSAGLQVDNKIWKLGRLNHVAVAVPDLEKAMNFYKNVLGAQDVSDAVPQPEHGVYTVFVNLGNTKIELLHPYGDKSPIRHFLEKNKMGGIHHICIEVNDVKAAMEDLTSQEIRVLDSKPKIGAHGNPVVFLHPRDCGGVLVELEEVK